jgi:membrane protease YdiL (CAAX protease family)
MRLYVFTKQDAFLITIFSLIAGLLFGTYLQGFFAKINDSQTLQLLAMAIGEALILGPLMLVMNIKKVKFHHILPLKKLNLQTWGMVFLMAIGVLALQEVIAKSTVDYFQIPEFLKGINDSVMWESPLQYILVIFGGVIFASITEEFLFRGVLQQSITANHQSLIPGIVVPAVVFSLFHAAYLFYIPAVIEIVLISLILGYVVAKTGNILASILIHSINNFSGITFLGLYGDDFYIFFPESGFPWMALFGMIALAISLYYLVGRKSFIPDEENIIE